jgi:hypothetical protein
MRKLVAVLSVVAMTILGISNAQAFDVTRGDENISSYRVATSGTTQAAIWSVNTPMGNDPEIATVSISVKRGKADWSTPQTLDTFTDTYISPAVEVRKNGTVFAVWVVDGHLYFSESGTKNNSFSTPAELPNASGLEFEGSLELLTINNSMTIAAAVQLTDAGEFGVEYLGEYWLATWHRKASSSTWRRDFVMNAFPESEFSPCDSQTQARCYYNISSVTISGNAKGQQTVTIGASLETQVTDEDPSTEKRTISTSQRGKPSLYWDSQQIISTVGPIEINSYNNLVYSNITTPAGKTAISFSYGFNDEPSKDKIFVSTKLGKRFKSQDVKALNRGYGTSDIRLSAEGETLYAAFNRQLDSDWSHLNAYFGKVGKLSKAKKLPTGDGGRTEGLAIIKGTPVVVLSKIQNNQVTEYGSLIFSKNKWKYKKFQFNPPTGYGLTFWFYWYYSDTHFIFSTIYDDLDPEIWSPIGVDVVTLI